MVTVENTNGPDYRVYYVQQDAKFVPRPSRVAKNFVGAPGNGMLTNAQLSTTHKVAVAGAIAPSSAVKMEGVVGLVDFV